MITYLLPTRDRADRLALTLARLGQLDRAAHAAIGGAEVIVVDDGSTSPVTISGCLANGWPMRVIRTDLSRGAACRNVGAEAARGTWLAMLDDDAYPLDAAAVDVVRATSPDVAAIGGEITLPSGRHEDGGLPEVIVGCGALIRRDAFLDVGGYDASFHYYVEEYDLCARLIAAGWRITHDWRWRVRHEKVAAGRDMDTILTRLVRNGGWVIQRYAPEAERVTMLERNDRRYAAVARRENAELGYEEGRRQLAATIDEQGRTPLAPEAWSRFVGRTAVAQTLDGVRERLPSRLALIGRGKHAWVVEEQLADLGISSDDDAPDSIIATLSPGPLVDAAIAASAPGVWCPWRPPHAPAVASNLAGLVSVQ